MKRNIRVQKTLMGYTAEQILKRCKQIATIGGDTNTVVVLPTFSSTSRHYTLIENTPKQIVLESGLCRWAVAKERKIQKPKKYAKAGGLRCPVCTSDQIEGSSFDCECGEVFQKISCSDCESVWYDRYELTGYVELDEGDSHAL